VAYRGELFDRNGPIQFAQAVGVIPDAMGKVVASFVALGAKSQPVLEGIKQQLKDINSLSGQIGQLGGAGNWQTSKTGRTGNTGGTQGNTTGVGGGASPGSYQPQGAGVPLGTAGQPPNQSIGAMAGRAAEAIPPALGGMAANYVNQNLTGMTQATLLGAQYARVAGGGWTKSAQDRFSQNATGGRFGQSQSDVATSAAVQFSLTGVPTTTIPGFSSARSVSQGAMLTQASNAMQVMLPGTSAVQSSQSVAGLYSTRNMRAMMMRGVPLPQMGGIKENPQVVFEQILNSLTSGRGDSMTPALFMEMMSENGPMLPQVTEMLGGDPALVNMFIEWGKAKTAFQTKNPGKVAVGGAGQPNFLSPEQLKASGFTQNPAYTSLRRTSAKAQSQNQLAPGISDATQIFDRAARIFSDAVTSLLKNTGMGGPLGFGMTLLGKSGFPLGGLGGLIGSLTGGGGASGIGSSLGSMGSAIGGAVKSVFGGASSLMGGIAPAASGIFANAGGMFSHLLGNISTAVIGAPSTTPSTGSKSTAPSTGGGTSNGTPASNRALGQKMAAARGWTGAEWQALDTLWGTYESGWRSGADSKNPTSPAAGIAQADPATKYPKAGQAPPVGTYDPASQIQWGLDYIAGRYKTPSAALAFELSHTPHWYARGTQDVDRTQLAMLHRGERVIPAAENFSMAGRYSRQAQEGSSGPSIVFSKGSIVVQATTLPNGQVDGQKTGQAIGDGILAKLRSS
jgi:hypothetical protein